jgi:Tfp pilus assembly protein PilO
MNSSPTSNSKQARRPKKKLNLLSWADHLEQWEKGARYLFVGMAGLSLVAYSYMVYTQDQWQVNHRQLQRLKNQENQQAIVNAQMRNQAAEKAEKSSSMIDPVPSRAVFMPANDQAPPVPTAEPTASSEETLQKPIGY